MDPMKVREAFQRGASQTASPAQGRPERVMAPLLHDDVPTFAEAPAVSAAQGLEGAGAAVLGIPFEGVRLLDPVDLRAGRRGARRRTALSTGAAAPTQGPQAIRRHSVFYSLRHGRGYLPEVDLDLVITDHLHLVDYGDVAVAAGDVEETFLRAHEKLADILAAGAVPIVLGGDHSIPIPVLQVLSGKLNGKLGIVVLDSQFDMSYEPKYWAGSQWARAFDLGVVEPENFVQIGLHGGRECLADKAVAERARLPLLHHERRRRARYRHRRPGSPRDGHDRHRGALRLARRGRGRPGLRRPEAHPDPGGLSARELLRALRVLSRGPVAGFDVCGLAPRYDLQGHLSQLAARAALEVIAGIALQRP